jgi:phage terminase large subunit-like protein
MRYAKAWRDEYARELTAFPGSKFDDQLDSTSQALEHLKMNRSLMVWELLGRD